MTALQMGFRRATGAFVLGVAFSSVPLSAPAGEAMRIVVAQAADPSDAAWDMVRDTVDPASLQRFLVQYPNSPHAAEAEARLDILNDRGSPILLAPNPEPEPAPITAPAQETPTASNLVMELQRELKRVGCYSGSVDGDWGPRSRRSLGAFGDATGSSVGSLPSVAALAAVKAQSNRVCVAVAAPQESGGNSGGGGGDGVATKAAPSEPQQEPQSFVGTWTFFEECPEGGPFSGRVVLTSAGPNGVDGKTIGPLNWTTRISGGAAVGNRITFTNINVGEPEVWSGRASGSRVDGTVVGGRFGDCTFTMSR